MPLFAPIVSHDVATYTIYIDVLDSNRIKARNGTTGAIDYNGTDAATVINNALAAVPSTGGRVEVAPGTYALTAPLVMSTNWTALVGSGIRGTTLITVASLTSLPYMLIVGPTTDIGGCLIQGLHFNGVNNTNPNGDGILIYGGDHCVRDIRLQQAPRDGFVWDAHSTGSVDCFSENLYSIQNGRDAYSITAKVSSSEWIECKAAGGTTSTNLKGRCGFFTTGSNNKFLSCHAYFFIYHGFFANAGQDVQIIGGEWETNGVNGIDLFASAGQINNYFISGAGFYSNNRNGGVIASEPVVLPTANSGGMDLYMDGTIHPVTLISIHGCNFFNGGAVNNIQAGQLTQSTISSCSFAGAANVAIRTLNFTANCTIIGNNFGGSSGSAVFLDGNTQHTTLAYNTTSRAIEERGSADFNIIEHTTWIGGGSIVVLGAHSVERYSTGFRTVNLPVADLPVATSVLPGAVRVAFINPREYGALGDGVADDTTAIQAALDAAGAGGHVFVPAGTYLVSDMLGLPTGVHLQGAGPRKTIIQQQTTNTPVVVSKSWPTAKQTLSPFWPTTTNGYTQVSDLALTGSSTGTGAHGLVLRDFYCRVRDVYVSSCGGHGFYLTPNNSSGAAVSGTLVENRFDRCKALSCGTASSSGWGFFLGETQNGKSTDGYLTDCIIDAGNGTQPAGHVFIGAAAGWKIDGIHTYGNIGTSSIRVVNGYRTRISNLYIESYWQSGLHLSTSQETIHVSDSYIGRFQSNASGIGIEITSQSGFTPIVYIMNPVIGNNQSSNPTNITAISNSNTPVTATVMVGKLTVISGSNTGTVTNYGGTGSGSISTLY